jgi:hypothetical protein
VGPVRAISLPSYILSDAAIIRFLNKLKPFAAGDPEVSDDGPCKRACWAMRELGEELRHRGGTCTLNPDGTWTIAPAPKGKKS